MGELNHPEDLKEMNREPWSKLTVKAEIPTLIEKDRDMIQIVKKSVYQEEIVDTLTEIMKAVNSRGFAINSAINWRKLTNFAE